MAAYQYIYTSCKRTKVNDKKEFMLRVCTDINDHSLDLIYIQELGFGLTPRMWLARQLWQRVDENNIIIVNKTVDSSQTYDEAYMEANVKMNPIRATAKMYAGRASEDGRTKQQRAKRRSFARSPSFL